MMKYIVLLIVCSVFQINAQEATVFGTWKTVDDVTGETKSTLEIFEKEGKVFGKIIAITDVNHQNDLCDLCKGEEKDTPLIGLTIIKNLKKTGSRYAGGTIFDPENGKEYRAKIWVDEEDSSRLNVRGYVAFFFRTQQWIRVN